MLYKDGDKKSEDTVDHLNQTLLSDTLKSTKNNVVVPL